MTGGRRLDSMQESLIPAELQILMTCIVCKSPPPQGREVKIYMPGYGFYTSLMHTRNLKMSLFGAGKDAAQIQFSLSETLKSTARE